MGCGGVGLWVCGYIGGWVGEGEKIGKGIE